MKTETRGPGIAPPSNRKHDTKHSIRAPGRDKNSDKMNITINHNGFHGHCSITLRLNGKSGDVVELSESQIRKLETHPCGMSDCRCGESMIRVCSDWGHSEAPKMMIIPETGEITLRGNYPQ